ncbi:hypothetical protein Pan54_52430 [Rubinisphaera italica]|uniref:Uncharacterized protein n=2 Tax=Rubinisphaera italica TaxID=2527969 RepID=A0A5C5XPI5_9PLAN|nr:hypothetical protein Pan54_52430 [Rubinisphaera italica]
MNELMRITLLLVMAIVLVPGCKPNSTVTENEPAAAPEPEKRPNLLKRKTQEVVDKNKVMAENPALIEVENKVTGNDPLSTALTGYIAASSRVNVLNFQRQIDLMKATEDRNPTYQEIVDVIKQNNMEFNALPDYQMFAYDETTGGFGILEDPDAKKAFYDQVK